MDKISIAGDIELVSVSNMRPPEFSGKSFSADEAG
jgi:hypothetical protein